jgi:hypothetical protein
MFYLKKNNKCGSVEVVSVLSNVGAFENEEYE